MTDQNNYNYEHFPENMDEPLFEQFPDLMNVGDIAPEGSVIRLRDEEEVPLSDLWIDQPAVLEFGSLT